MAEWLGTGLQNLGQQFDSAWYLQFYELTNLLMVSSFCYERDNKDTD